MKIVNCSDCLRLDLSKPCPAGYEGQRIKCNDFIEKIGCSICGDSFTGVFKLELLRTAKYGTILFPKPKLIVCGNCLAQKFENENENFYNWFYSLSK